MKEQGKIPEGIKLLAQSVAALGVACLAESIFTEEATGTMIFGIYCLIAPVVSLLILEDSK